MKKQYHRKLNVHIYPSPFENESRILKVTKSLIMHNIVESVLIIAKAKAGLPQGQQIDDFRHVLRVKAGIDGPGLLAKIIGFIEWSISVIMQLKHEAVDMVNCHSLSVLPLCVALKFRHHCLLVYEPHELETETHESKGIRKKLAKITEKALIRFVDKTFVVSASIADWYAQQYKIKRPVVVLNAPRQTDVKQSDYFRKTFNLSNDTIIFIYQGNLGQGRGIHLLLETFKNRKDNSVMVIMGHGELENHVKKLATNSPSIFFHPAVPPDKVLDYTASADIGFAMVQNTCLSHDFSMPNKLFEYLMAGLPVIVPPSREMKAFVEKHKFGVSITAETTEAVNQGINQIKSMNLNELKLNARKTAWECAWEVQEKTMIEGYKSLLSNP